MDYQETVTIKLETYNELRDFQTEVLNGAAVKVSSRGISFHETSDITTELAEEIDKLETNSAEQKTTIKKLEADLRTAIFEVRAIETRFAAMTADKYIDWKKQYNLENL